MSKAYWISTYQKINNPDKLAAYAALAGPAIIAGGGKFIVRGMPVKTYEAGVNERTVVIEFDSVDAAIATHDSPAMQRRWRHWMMVPSVKFGLSKGHSTTLFPKTQ